MVPNRPVLTVTHRGTPSPRRSRPDLRRIWAWGPTLGVQASGLRSPHKALGCPRPLAAPDPRHASHYAAGTAADGALSFGAAVQCGHGTCGSPGGRVHRGLPAWQQDVCQQLREIIRTADPDIEETIKRSVQPYFVLDGNVCALLATKDHVSPDLRGRPHQPLGADRAAQGDRREQPSRWVAAPPQPWSLSKTALARHATFRPASHLHGRRATG